jgi:hypothetical protein
MQSLPTAISEVIDCDDMGQKELSASLAKLTGRVTSLEKKTSSTNKSPQEEKWNTDRWIAFGILVFTVIGVPIILGSWIESHIQTDLKSGIKNEVTDQLKEPLKQISEIAGDVREIKGKLEILAPLIQEITIKRLGEVGNLDSKDLLARLPELRHLANIAKTESVTVKPETVEKVGQKLIAAGTTDAWNTALDFVNYKSFLNVSLSVAVSNVMTSGTLNTTYERNVPVGMQPPRFSVAGTAQREQSAQFLDMRKIDPNASLAFGNDWIIATDGAVILDNMQLRKVIFKNVYIQYDGGPIKMQDVYFLNCTFVITKQRNGELLATNVLKPSPAVNFNAS